MGRIDWNARSRNREMNKWSIKLQDPSASEANLRAQQQHQLDTQASEMEALKPYILFALGMRPNAKGGYDQIPFEERYAAMTPEEQADYDLTQEYRKRQLASVRGEIGASPALEADLERQKEELANKMSSRLGSNWRTSTTAGIQGMSRFDQAANIAREESRRADMGLLENMITSRSGQRAGQAQERYANLTGYGSWRQPIWQGYAQAAQPYQTDRELALKARQANVKAKAGMMSTGGNIVGSIIGGMSSSIDFKKDIVKLSSEDIKKVALDLMASDLYHYRYNEEADTHKGHIGVVTEKAPDAVVTPDGKHIDIVSYLGALTAAVKMLVEKVNGMEVAHG